MTSEYEVFGLRLLSQFPLVELDEVPPGPAPDLQISLAPAAEVEGAFSGPATPPRVHETVLGDGCRYRVERGADGDHSIEYGERAAFHLSLGATLVRCAPHDVDDPAWRRFLLDTVLGTAALVHGYEALHAGAALGDRGLVAISADTGGGKSTVLATLLRRGYALFADDILTMSRHDDRVLASPGPPLMNLEPMLIDGTPASALGRVLSIVDGECWTRIERPAMNASPVRAVVFLERGQSERATIDVLAADPAVLLAHSLTSGQEPARRAVRLALFGDLAEQAQLVRLRASTTTTPGELADLVESVLT